MEKRNNQGGAPDTKPSQQPAERQEKSDPQLTELRGYADADEDLEPTLTDGTKAPDKADEENANNRKGI